MIMSIANASFRSATILGMAAIAVAVLSGCESTKRMLGQTKDAPDEFTVYSRAPLSLPPEFSLRPPQPGSERPQAVNPRDRAREAIITAGGARAENPQPANGEEGEASRGETAILHRTGALNADSQVRGVIDRESAFLAEEEKTITDRIIFWGVPTESGAAVDAAAEAKRLREARALGQPLGDGTVPVIQRRQKGLFEDLVK
jgi:hypothetical protein